MFTIPFTYWAGESTLPLQNVLVAGNGSFSAVTFNGVTVNRGILKMDSNGVVDTTFNSGGIGVSNTSTIIAAIPQSTGKIVIYYSGIGGTPRYQSNGITYSLTGTSLARLNADGTWDTTFQSPESGKARVEGNNGNYGNNKTLVVLDDDSIVVINEYNRIVEKYPPNGALTPTNSATFNNVPHAIKKTADGKIFAVGIFTTVNGVTNNRMVRLNSDLSIDTSFNTGAGLNNTAFNVEIQSDGKAIIGGIYTTVSAVARSFVNRQYVDGINSGSPFDTGYVPNITATTATNVYSTLSRTAIQSDDKLLSSGGTSSSTFNYDGTSLAGSMIYRVNTDGTLDFSFIPIRPNNRLYSFAQLNNGKILVGSLATTIGGSGQPTVATTNFYRLNADGTLDTTFAMTGASSWVRNITIL